MRSKRHSTILRCQVVTVLLAGLSLSACGGDSNTAFAPHLPVTSVRPLSDLLYSFGQAGDGANPEAGLLAGKNAEYYGTTADGGGYGGGTAYEITAAGQEKVLHSFGNGKSDGSFPQSSTLVMDKEGALYGTTELGGGKESLCGAGCGTVFKLTPGKPAWTATILYAFGGTDGAYPLGGLLMTKGGTLLGTTFLADGNQGNVFELTPSGTSYRETVIHQFTGPPDGWNPTDAPVSDSSGNLYGTTSAGGLSTGTSSCQYGAEGYGTIFKLTPSRSKYRYSVIYRFKGGRDGMCPTAGLLPGPHGVLYGLTNYGGAPYGKGNGTVFELEPNGSRYREKVIYSFKGGADGSEPNDTPGLVADRGGNLYGTTVSGGRGTGIVFRLVPAGKRFTKHLVYEFQGGTSDDGASPYGGVIIDSKGNLLGTTELGGSNNYGTVFSVCCAP